MRVYRLERVSDHRSGPFQVHRDIDPIGLMLGRQDTLQDTVTPAQAAMIVGQIFGGKNPFDMPTIVQDVGGEDILTEYMLSKGREPSDYVFGFKSLKEYKQWFETPMQRQALFDYDKEDPIELRVFEVPDKEVLVTPHQVMFPIDIAKEGEVISRAKAIK